MLFSKYVSDSLISKVEGQTAVVLKFKRTKDIPNPPDACYAIVPMVSKDIDREVVTTDDKLKEMISGLVTELQERMVKAVYEKKFSTSANGNLVDVLAFYEHESTSQRLSTERIEAWFTTDLEQTLVNKMVEKNPAITPEAIKATIKTVTTSFSTLSAVTPALSIPTAKKLYAELLPLAPVSSMSKVLAKKLDSIINPKAGKQLIDSNLANI